MVEIGANIPVDPLLTVRPMEAGRGPIDEPFSAIQQGLERGQAYNINQEKLEILQRSNSPEAIAQEQHQRELKLRAAELELQKATVDLSYAGKQNQAELLKQEALADAASARASYLKEQTRYVPLEAGANIYKDIRERKGKGEEDTSGVRLTRDAEGNVVSIPAAQSTEPVGMDPAEQLKQNVINGYDSLSRKLEINDGISERQKQLAGTSKLQDTSLLLNRGSDNYNKFLNYTAQSGLDKMDAEAYLPILLDRGSIVKDLQSTDPQVQDGAIEQSKDMFRKLGGYQAIMDDIDKDITDNETKKNLKSEVNALAAYTFDDISMLPDQQQTIAQAGLPKEYIANPDRAQQDLSFALTGKDSDIKNNIFKDRILDNPLVQEARNATNYGTRPYRVSIESGGGEARADVAVPSGRQIVFRDPQTNEPIGKPVAFEETPENKAVLNMLRDAAPTISQTGSQTLQNINKANQIEQRQQKEASYTDASDFARDSQIKQMQAEPGITWEKGNWGITKVQNNNLDIEFPLQQRTIDQEVRDDALSMQEMTGSPLDTDALIKLKESARKNRDDYKSTDSMKSLNDEIVKTQTQIRTDSKNAARTAKVLDTAVRTGNVEILGPDQKVNRWLIDGLNTLGIKTDADSFRQMAKENQITMLLEAMTNKSRAMDANKEQERILQAFPGEEMTAQTMQYIINRLEQDSISNENYNAMRQFLTSVGYDANMDASEIMRISDAYINDPSLSSYVDPITLEKNENFMYWDQYLGKRKKQQEDQKKNEEIAPTVETPPTSAQTDIFAPEQMRAAADLKGPTALSNAQTQITELQTSLEQNPEAQKTLQQVSEELGIKEEMSPMAGGGALGEALPNVFSQIVDKANNAASWLGDVAVATIDKVVPDPIENYMIKALYDQPSLQTAMTRAAIERGMTKEQFIEQSVQNYAEERDKIPTESPGANIVGEGLAFMVAGGALKSATMGALQKAAQYSPKIASLVKLVTASGEAAQRVGRGTALTQTALQTTGRAALGATTAAGIRAAEGEDITGTELGIAAGAEAVGGPILGWTLNKLRSGAVRANDFVKAVFGKGDPEKMLAKRMVQFGIPKNTISQIQTQIQEEGIGSTFSTLLGTDNPQLRNFLEELASSPEWKEYAAKSGWKGKGERVISKTISELFDKSLQATGDIAESYSNAIKQELDTVAGETSKNVAQVSNQLIDTITSSAKKDTNKLLNDIDDYVKQVGSEIKTPRADITIGTAQTAEEVGLVGAGASEAIVKTRDVLESGMRNIYKAFDDKFKEGFIDTIDEGTYTGDSFKILTDLADNIGAPFREAEAVVTSANEGINKNSFEYFHKLRSYLSAQTTKVPSVAKGKIVEATESLTDIINKGLTQKGLEDKAFSNIQSIYSKSLEGLDYLDYLKNISDEVTAKARLGGATNLEKTIFGSGSKFAKATERLPKQTRDKLQTELRSVDKYTKALDSITQGKNLTKNIDILGENITTASKYIDTVDLGKDLLKTTPKTINKVVSALPKEQQTLVRNSALSKIKNDIEEFTVSEVGKKFKFKDFAPKDLLGYSKKEWDNITSMVGKDTAKVLDNSFNKIITENNIQTLMDFGSGKAITDITQPQAAAAARRVVYNNIAIVTDLLATVGMSTAARTEARTLSKALTQGSPDDVVKLFNNAVSMLTSGREKLGLKAVNYNSEDIARAMYGVYLSRNDVSAKQLAQIKTELEQESKKAQTLMQEYRAGKRKR